MGSCHKSTRNGSENWGDGPKPASSIQILINFLNLYQSLILSARHGYDSKYFWFESTWSPKVLIRLNSWLTMALQKLIQISSRLKMDFWKLIQIDLRLKKLQEYFDSNQLITLKTFQDFDSNQLMTKKNLEHWFELSLDSMIRINCRFRWPFLGLSLNFADFFGLSLNFVYLFWAFT